MLSEPSKSVFRNEKLQIIFLITLMAVLGVASITPAFPAIIQKLKITNEEVGYLITVFTLPGIFLTAPLGMLADKFGRKFILVPALFLFGLSGLLCVFTYDFNTILLLRFFQGVGSAPLSSLAITLIGDFFDRQERIQAMGYNASILSVGTAVYPVLGGFLASLQWNYVFLLALLAVPVGFIVLFWLEENKITDSPDIKTYLSSIMILLKNSGIIVFLLASIISFIILYGSLMTYFPVHIHNQTAFGPAEIGILLSTMSLITALVSSRLSFLTRIISTHKLLLVSYVFYSLALAIAIFSSDIIMFILVVVVFGLGHGINIPVLQSLLTELAPVQYRGAFMSLNGMVLRIGQTIGPIICGICFIIAGITGAFLCGIISGLIIIFILYIKGK